jgi:hypothetical protein
MKSAFYWLINLAFFVGGPPTAYAQTYAPTVTMTITAPTGETQEVSARDSGVATLKLKDGSVYEVRPTVQDEPFTRVTVAIFKAATTTTAVEPIGEVEVTKGGAPAAMKSTPSFKNAVKSIELAPKRTS